MSPARVAHPSAVPRLTRSAAHPHASRATRLACLRSVLPSPCLSLGAACWEEAPPHVTPLFQRHTRHQILIQQVNKCQCGAGLRRHLSTAPGLARASLACFFFITLQFTTRSHLRLAGMCRTGPASTTRSSDCGRWLRHRHRHRHLHTRQPQLRRKRSVCPSPAD